MVIVIQQGQPVVVMLNDIQHLPGIQSVNGTPHQFNHLPQLAHAVFMHDIATHQVLAQTLCCPDAELSTAFGIHPIPHGKYHIQIVITHRSPHGGFPSCRTCKNSLQVPSP